jgi:ribonuclease HI
MVAYVDGGSRGNPGIAGYGVQILDERGHALAALSGTLGVQSNNYAEYSGLIAALDYAYSNRFEKVTIFADSELMVRQVNRVYKVRSPNLKKLFAQARSLIGRFKEFSIQHVPRAQNREADRLANLAMDSLDSDE